MVSVEERAGTQFTCFTGAKVHGTKVQILTLRPQSSLNLYWFLGREEFKYTCIGSNTAHMCATLPAVATCKSSIICEAVSKSRMMQSRGL